MASSGRVSMMSSESIQNSGRVVDWVGSTSGRSGRSPGWVRNRVRSLTGLGQKPGRVTGSSWRQHDVNTR